MNISQLKILTSVHHPFFFSRGSMRFFGDTLANYGIRSAKVFTCFDADGKYTPTIIEVDVWELYRKRPVKNNLKESTYFSKETGSLAYKEDQEF